MFKYFYNLLICVVAFLTIGLVCIMGYAVFQQMFASKFDRVESGELGRLYRQSSYISQSFIDTIIPVRGMLDNYYAQHREWPSGSTEQIHQQLRLPEIIQSDYVQSLLVDQDGTIQVQFTDLIDSNATLIMTPIQSGNKPQVIWSCNSTLHISDLGCTKPS